LIHKTKFEIKAYKIDGDIDSGAINRNKVLAVKELLAPITREECKYIRPGGLNYKDHAKEANLSLPSVPILFFKPRAALIGPYPLVVNIPKCAQDGTSDYEAELCIVIGKSGQHLATRLVCNICKRMNDDQCTQGHDLYGKSM
jgi:2-keto-4-pentenoate hydratase/2-oxohepta-3-ene-1,7-dioic acid hydratase in catechol pathway